jgi:hypothetical protein
MPLLGRRISTARSLAEKLFLLMMLADDRVVSRTHVMGQRVHGAEA